MATNEWLPLLGGGGYWAYQPNWANKANSLKPKLQ